MSRLKFGDIASMDYEPDLRLMLVAVDQGQTGLRSIRYGRTSPVWRAMVLADIENGWHQGLLVTVPEDVSGFILIESLEGSGLA